MKLQTSHIQHHIHEIRGFKVMLDSDLARLYGVETKTLKRAVRRNIERFPADFMFKLNRTEAESSRYQIGTLNKSRGYNIKYLPLAFTEQGIAMLSGVLNSKRAITVNIAIMRAFVKIHSNLEALSLRIEELEHKHDQNILTLLARLPRKKN